MNTDSNIPKNHPRARSLQVRERMKQGVEQGLVHATGLIAHGRGEAFDYLLGERSPAANDAAVDAAASLLRHANHPVLSLNGNVVVLAAKECLQLQQALPNLVLEVNLFHRTQERIAGLVGAMQEAGATVPILGAGADQRIPGLESDRALCEEHGIYKADVVLVPLEDGDRCQALVAMGKTVITIDLNPLSRTAKSSHVTLVDECTRVLELLAARVAQAPPPQAFDNRAHLQSMVAVMQKGLAEGIRQA